MKRYNNKVQRGEVTHYYEDYKLYVIVYANGKNKKIDQYQLNRYKCTDTDRDRTRRIMRASTRLQRGHLVTETTNTSSPTGDKLPAHLAMAVYDEDTGKMIDYKQLINHSNQQTREWWQKSSANENGKLLKGVGRNKDGTQRVKGSDTINFIQRMHVSIEKKITYACFCCDV